jgi:hypothetical protein
MVEFGGRLESGLIALEGLLHRMRPAGQSRSLIHGYPMTEHDNEPLRRLTNFESWKRAGVPWDERIGQSTLIDS